MARAHAEVEAIATWEIFTDGDALVDWSCPVVSQSRFRPVPDPCALQSVDVVGHASRYERNPQHPL